MLMDETLQSELNQRLNDEMYSAYKYFAMATYFAEINLSGFAKYMHQNAKEEWGHGEKVYDYLLLRQMPVKLQSVEVSDTNWINPMDVFENALSHERVITEKYNRFYEMAVEKNDHALAFFLEDFVREQVEEEAKFATLLERIKVAQHCPCGLAAINQEFLGNILK